jgi:peptide/nickel transport system permease protein
MKLLLNNIKQLWKSKFLFRLALGYLLLLIVLLLVLPWLPVAYGANTLDLQHIFQPPFKSIKAGTTQPVHWLGTDALGRDVFSNMLYGARNALFISIPVMVLSSLFGTLAGTAAGFFGDTKLKLTLASLTGLLLTLFLFGYYGIYVPLQLADLGVGTTAILSSFGTLLVLVAILYKGIIPLLQKLPVFCTPIAFPVDQLVIRLIEGFTSIPKLILILVIASFIAPSVTLLSVILVLTYWTATARLARAEMIKIRELPYFEAAISLGIPARQLIFKQALPNMLGPLVVTFTFGLAGLLTLESTLSFLGIGLPGTFVTWGRIIAGIRSNTAAWWLVAFPGAFLALTIVALQACSYCLLSIIRTGKNS